MQKEKAPVNGAATPGGLILSMKAGTTPLACLYLTILPLNVNSFFQKEKPPENAANIRGLVNNEA